MQVFFYDKTFEGLLTAVFDAYSRKVFPDKLLGENDIPPLFMDGSYTVVTQEDKALRVWGALEKKLSKQACNMLTYAWLSETEGCGELLFRYIRKVFDNRVSIEANFGDKDVLELHQLARKVSHEGHYLEQFIRFQKAADGIYFAPVSPVYNALPLVIEHFADRFSDQKWLIYDVKRKYGYFYDLKIVEEVTLQDDKHLLSGKLDDELMAEDEKLFQELWKGYFKAIAIKERINPRLQRQNMPRRFWKYLIEKQ
jgi:probable DNA metabolism protein